MIRYSGRLAYLFLPDLVGRSLSIIVSTHGFLQQQSDTLFLEILNGQIRHNLKSSSRHFHSKGLHDLLDIGNMHRELSSAHHLDTGSGPTNEQELCALRLELGIKYELIVSNHHTHITKVRLVILKMLLELRETTGAYG